MGVLRSLNTAIKAVFSQTCYGRRNIDGRERRTTVKAVFSQTCYGRWNIDGRERRTITKAIVSQTCYGRRNIDGRERRTALKAGVSQTCHAIHHTFISNTLWNRDFCCGAIISCKFCSFCLCVQFVLESVTGAVFNDVGTYRHAHNGKEWDEHESQCNQILHI